MSGISVLFFLKCIWVVFGDVFVEVPAEVEALDVSRFLVLFQELFDGSSCFTVFFLLGCEIECEAVVFSCDFFHAVFSYGFVGVASSIGGVAARFILLFLMYWMAMTDKGIATPARSMPMRVIAIVSVLSAPWIRT